MHKRKYFGGNQVNTAECFFYQRRCRGEKFFLLQSLYSASQKVCYFYQKENIVRFCDP